MTIQSITTGPYSPRPLYGAQAVANLKRGEWGDVKVTVTGGALNRLTVGKLLKVAELTGDLSRVRLFHPSGTRANASWVRSLRTWTASSSIPLFCPLICQVRHTLLVM
jgi:hypothetical protein